MENKENSTGLYIMARLIVLVKPLTIVMLLGIILGTLGHICAIFVTVIGAEGVAMALESFSNPILVKELSSYVKILVSVAVLRGLLHYGEQYCNHYIAFRILAIIRHKVFDKLRKLCPAKLETREKGNLITMITTDIELLEVFFAHTISPIAIAILVSVFMVFFIGKQYPPAGIIAAIAYVVVGGMIPVSNEVNSANAGLKLSLPLFEGFSTKSQVKQKKLYYENAQASYDNLKKTIRIEVKAAWLNLQEAKQRIESTKGVVEQAQENLNSKMLRYRNGLISQLELNDAISDLNDSNLSYVQAVYDAHVALSDLNYAVGLETKDYE